MKTHGRVDVVDAAKARRLPQVTALVHDLVANSSPSYAPFHGDDPMWGARTAISMSSVLLHHANAGLRVTFLSRGPWGPGVVDKVEGGVNRRPELTYLGPSHLSCSLAKEAVLKCNWRMIIECVTVPTSTMECGTSATETLNRSYAIGRLPK